MSGLLARLAAAFVAPDTTPPAEEPRRARRRPAHAAPEVVALVPSAPAPFERAPVVAEAEDVPSAADEAPPGLPAAGGGGAAATVAVLARPADAWAAGGAVALGLLGTARAPVAVVCVWGGGPGPSALAPATPAARRLAGRLAERGHRARAGGRLVIVALDEEVAPACAEAERVAAALPDEPLVVVLAGARDERVDALLARHDRVVVAGSAPDDAVADLAAANLASIVVPVRVVALAPAAPARALAATGVALLAPLRAAIEEGLR
jgi:hypothetical protein